jgi:small-conductance mechanosensitive channel
MDVQQAINLDIYRTFQGQGIEFAYPTQTLLVQPNRRPDQPPP